MTCREGFGGLDVERAYKYLKIMRRNHATAHHCASLPSRDGRFVKCVKTNSSKLPMVMEEADCQSTGNGVSETWTRHVGGTHGKQ